MTPGFILRILVTTTIMLCISLSGGTALTAAAFAGTPDRDGNNAEVYSITITPQTVAPGTYPQIKGFVRNTSSATNGDNGKAAFDVVAVITTPSGAQKSMIWRDVKFDADQRKSYTAANTYDIKQAGTYKIVYTVYNSDRTHVYAAVSKTFSASSPAGTKHEPKAPVVRQQEPARKPAAAKPEKPRKSEIVERAPIQTAAEDRKYIGLGGYVNALNFSGGGTFIAWPLRNLAVQGTYGVGTFTSYEGRVFYRFPLPGRYKPYLGAGYIHAERDANVIGLKTTVTGDSFTAFGGVEMQLYRNLYGYVDVSGSPMKLEKDVTNGTQAATIKVEYAPATINVGVVFYLF